MGLCVAQTMLSRELAAMIEGPKDLSVLQVCVHLCSQHRPLCQRC